MSFSPLSFSSGLSERLTPARVRQLAGLIAKSEHPQPSPTLVSPLLELLVGGAFDARDNLLIKEPAVLLLLVELLPHLSEEIQVELWSSVGAILRGSLWNVHCCRHLHLVEKCLHSLHRTTSVKVAGQLVKVVETLGTYNVTVKELKFILSYLYTTQLWAPHCVLLVEALNNILLGVQPDVFFNFSGGQGATLTLPPISKWPTQSGFTFFTWLRLENPFDSQRDYYKPVVYWFRTGKGYGFSAHFIGNTLVLETAGRSHKKPQTHPLPFFFLHNQWYMLGVGYNYHRLRSSELECYVDGQLVLTADVSMPTSDDIYDKCFLGSSPSATPDATFQGQMTAVYLFRERLSRETMAALHLLGPGYKNQFKFDAETNVPLTDHQRKLLFDGRLSEAVVFSYNAKAVDGQLALESSPLENPSPFVHSPHATLLEGVEPVVTHSLESALHSLGGVQVLFPLFSQLDLPHSLPDPLSPAKTCPQPVHYQLATRVLAMVFQLNRLSTSFMNQTIQSRSLCLIRYLLEKVDPQHLSVDVVNCVLDFLRYLAGAAHGSDLLHQLIEHFVFSPGLWARADTTVQIQLYSRLAAEFCGGGCQGSPLPGVVLREEVGMAHLLFSLREYYSVAGGNEGGDASTGEREKREEVRSYILLLVRKFISMDKGIREDEMTSILSYLSTVPEEENLVDIVLLLVALLFEDTSGNVVRLFEKLDGLNVAAKLLACTSEEITLYALKMIGRVLHMSQSRHQKQLLQSTSILTVVREKLLSSGQPVSIAMFNSLFEVLVNCPSRRIVSGHYVALDLSHSIHFPEMLAVMVEAVCSLHTSTSDWAEGDTLVRMQLFSYIASLCAQNQANCKALLRLRQWQHWLLELADQQDASESDRGSLQQLLYQLYHSILLYCFQEEQDGWRVWVETTAAIHAHISTKNLQSLPPPSSLASHVSSSSPSSPASSTEGLRDIVSDSLPPSSSSSLPTHQLRTSLTAESPDPRDKENHIETQNHKREAGDVECDGHSVQTAGGDVSQTTHSEPDTRGSEREGGGKNDDVKSGVADSAAGGGRHLSTTESGHVKTETDPEMSTNAEGVTISRAEKTSGSTTPSSSLPSSLPDTPTDRRRLNRPPPLATPTATPPSVTSSSNESPTSPFFIPSNPFLSVVGRMPRFQWAAVHVTLLDTLLRSLLRIVQKWSTDNRIPSKSLGEEGNKFLRSNVAHLLALVSDVLVEMNGGLKRLLSKAVNPTPSDRIRLTESFRRSIGPTLKSTLSTDKLITRSLLTSILSLSEVMVVSGLLKLGVVETRMKMEQGGTYRQALRLVLTKACLNTMEHNIKNKVYQEHYQQRKKTVERDFRESEALLETLDISDSALKKYFRRGMEGKMDHLCDSQCLLSDHTLSLMARLLDRDTEGKQLQERVAKAMVYFLAVMCVSKYRSILEAVGRDISEEIPAYSTTNEGGGGQGAKISSEGEKCVPHAGEEGAAESLNQGKGERERSLEAVDGSTVKEKEGEREEGEEEDKKGDKNPEEGEIQRLMSVETDATATPDLEQTFHFPVGEERGGTSVTGVGEEGPVPASVVFYRQSMDTSEQIRAALRMVGPFLCGVLIGQRSGLGKLLVGSDGRPLLNDAVCRLAENQSLVEITMLLCSQEWQASLAKHGVKVFADLLTEGRSMVQFCEGYLRSVASREVADFKSTAESQLQHFTVFEEQLSVYLSQAVRSSCEVAQLRRAEWRRDTMYARELWRKVSSVVDEYGKFDRSPLSCPFLKMDLREDSQRQRLKLVANTHGSLHEDARRTMPADEEGEGGEDELDPVGMPLQSGPLTSSSQPDEGSLSSDELLETQVSAEQEQTRKLWSVQCRMLVMARALPGSLVFSHSSLSFNADDDCEEFGQLSHLMDYYAVNERWELSEVRAVFSRRYLHQNKALEIFFSNRSSVFLVFSSPREVREVVKRLPKVGTGAEYDLPQSRSTSLAPPQQLFRKSPMTTRWQRREISNFDYLMFLNTIAGRTYSDLNQYPVFPWVLSDYSSRILDLDDPSSFRDLTKPVGALNDQRLARLQERLECWEDERIPPFLYGTHYSTMAFVLHWLVRVEPFTTAHIQFHDGVFDQGSRMFTSIHQSWSNVCSDSANVKELIPELFYLPEMLTNHNKFYLGRQGACEEGEVIGDVELPPWADSAQEFIHLHREALESEYVSRNLHHWIDLIFGYKQRGEEAVKAKNMFYYLTYQGSIDLDSTTDPHLRKGLEDQIRHFGQTPSQLLTEPHPPRHPVVKENPPPPIQGAFPHDPALVAELQVTPDIPIALVQLSPSSSSLPSSSSSSPSAIASTSSLLVVTYNQLFAVNKWTVVPGKSSQVFLEPDPHIAGGLKTRLGDPLDQSLSPSSACFAALPENNVVFVCGFWDNSFRCFNTDTGATIQSVFGHREIVTCISYSGERGVWGTPGCGLLATGSHDATVMVWKWCGRQKRVIGSLNGLDNRGSVVTPEAVLTGHVEPVVCVCVSASLSLVVSGAKHGNCLVHNTSGELLHKLVSQFNWSFPHLISLTTRGHIVIHYADQKGCIGAFSCNGRQFAQCALGDPALAMTVSECGRYLVAGGFDCKVRVFLAHSLERNYVYEAFSSSIRSLHFSHDQRYIFAGLSSGSVAVLATHYWLDL